VEDGKVRHGLGHEVAIEAGPEVMQITPPVTAAGESGSFHGIVVQKSVMVMVREKDTTEWRSSTLTLGSEAEFEHVLPMNDEVVWADICFKGIVRG
jgi:hypothetical protein